MSTVFTHMLGGIATLLRKRTKKGKERLDDEGVNVDEEGLDDRRTDNTGFDAVLSDDSDNDDEKTSKHTVLKRGVYADDEFHEELSNKKLFTKTVVFPKLKSSADLLQKFESQILKSPCFSKISPVELLKFKEKIQKEQNGPYVFKIDANSKDPLYQRSFFLRRDRFFGTDFILTIFSYEFLRDMDSSMLVPGKFKFVVHSDERFIKIHSEGFSVFGMVKDSNGHFQEMRYLNNHKNIHDLIETETGHAAARNQKLRPEYHSIFFYHLFGRRDDKRTLLDYAKQKINSTIHGIQSPKPSTRRTKQGVNFHLP